MTATATTNTNTGSTTTTTATTLDCKDEDKLEGQGSLPARVRKFGFSVCWTLGREQSRRCDGATPRQLGQKLLPEIGVSGFPGPRTRAAFTPPSRRALPGPPLRHLYCMPFWKTDLVQALDFLRPEPELDPLSRTRHRASGKPQT